MTAAHARRWLMPRIRMLLRVRFAVLKQSLRKFLNHILLMMTCTVARQMYKNVQLASGTETCAASGAPATGAARRPTLHQSPCGRHALVGRPQLDFKTAHH